MFWACLERKYLEIIFRLMLKALKCCNSVDRLNRKSSKGIWQSRSRGHGQLDVSRILSVIGVTCFFINCMEYQAYFLRRAEGNRSFHLYAANFLLRTKVCMEKNSRVLSIHRYHIYGSYICRVLKKGIKIDSA